MTVSATIQLENITLNESSTNNDQKCIHDFHKDSRHFVRCDIYIQHQDIVKRFSYGNKIPSIATEEGTRFRTDVVENHWS